MYPGLTIQPMSAARNAAQDLVGETLGTLDGKKTKSGNICVFV